MIESFSNNDLENLYYENQTKGLNKDHVTKLKRILDRLAQTNNVMKDMRYPGSNLHKLEPKKEERWAVNVSENGV